MADYDIFREQLATTYRSYGHALWDPRSWKPDMRVEVGDVGFIRRGKFHQLFNVLRPKGEQSDVPEDYEQLVLRSSPHTSWGTLDPGHYYSAGITMDCVSERQTQNPDISQVSFKCSGRREGAVLSLPLEAQSEDTLAQDDFGKWVVNHIDCWFDYARQRGLGIERMEDIILVTGCHRTKSWMNVAFLGRHPDAEVSFGTEVINANVKFHISPKDVRGPVCKKGPEGTNLSEDQCIFIRGYRVARTRWFSRRRLRAEGGPSPDQEGHDSEPDMELISIPAISKYRDPLHVLIDYIAEQAHDCDMVLIHDDDLERIGKDISLGSLKQEALMDLLRRLKIEVHKVRYGGPPTLTESRRLFYSHGASTQKDLSPTSSDPNCDTGVTWVAMISDLSKDLSSTPLAPRPSTIGLGQPYPYEPDHQVLTPNPPFPLLLSFPTSMSNNFRFTFATTLAGYLKQDAKQFEVYCDEKRGLINSMVTNETSNPPYGVSSPEPVAIPEVIKSPPPAVPQAASWPDISEDFRVEGGFWGNIAEFPNIPTQPFPPLTATKSPPAVPPTVPARDSTDGVHLEGLWDNISEVPDVYSQPVIPPAEGMNDFVGEAGVGIASNSTARPASTTESGLSRWLPALREIRQRVQQFTEGRIERISHPSQSEPSIFLSLCRWGVRLLMSAASLSPADFASPVGYLGPLESTPYYPTGDIRGDRNVAFTTAVDCLDDLEAYLHGDGDLRIATKLFVLSQALSDLGLREYALNTSGFALEALERSYVAAPNNSRLLVASILSLRANILCDLKQNDESAAAANRAVTLCREHQSSRVDPVPELAYSLLNYAVILYSIGLKDESAAVAFEVCADDSRSDIKEIFALCKLCLSNTRIGADDDMAFSMAEEVIELTRSSSSDANSQTVLASALLNKSKILSSRGQSDVACSFSAEAVAIFRSMTAERPMFSLFLAHALDAHAHLLSKANRKGESYSIQKDAVELWQTLKISAGGAVARSLAWSAFELAKFRRQGSGRNSRREEFRIAESVMDMFRQVDPLDAPGLGDALYLYADRMLELDNNREAATYAEESVHYFREALSNDPKYALDVIFSLSLASSCLACTERAEDALEYAKQAVEVQHERQGVDDEQYNAHLRKLLMDVVFRATEMDKQEEAFPWFQELRALSELGEESGRPLQRQRGNSRGQRDEFKKQTSYWIDTNTNAQKSNDGSTSPPVASSSTLRVDKGKGKDVASEDEEKKFE